MLFEPRSDENLVNFESKYLHKDHLIDLDANSISEVDDTLAVSYQIREGSIDSLAEQERQRVLDLPCQQALKVFAGLIHIHLKLVSPVLNELNASFLAQPHVFLEHAE